MQLLGRCSDGLPLEDAGVVPWLSGGGPSEQPVHADQILGCHGESEAVAHARGSSRLVTCSTSQTAAGAVPQLSTLSSKPASSTTSIRAPEFLGEMAAVPPWAKLEALIEPHYPKM